MDGMVNMKMTKSDMEKSMNGSVLSQSPAYPYGLNIELDDKAIKKLGIKELPEAGEEMMIHAKVSVSRASSTDTKDGGKQQSLSLQITDLCLCEMEEEKDMAEEMYGKS